MTQALSATLLLSTDSQSHSCRLHLDDPSSAPQLEPFTGPFALARTVSGHPGSFDASADAARRVRLALEGYAAQGSAKELAEELLSAEERPLSGAKKSARNGEVFWGEEPGGASLGGRIDHDRQIAITRGGCCCCPQWMCGAMLWLSVAA